ncbi:hypothetical protein EI555_010925, partial [Monodon monoceros]
RWEEKMALLCYNRGCGQRFDPETNSDGKKSAPLALPPFYLFPWTPLGRRASRGCTKGRHNSEKPPEPVKPEVKTTEKKELSELKPKFQEHIIQAPKPIEAIKRPRHIRGKKVVPCRHDWHQTGGEVTISVYAKNSLPELSQVVANSTLLNVHIVFEGEKEFHQNVKLWGVIDVKRSYVTMTATKIEITMRKAEPMQWASLELPAAKIQEKQKEDTTE